MDCNSIEMRETMIPAPNGMTELVRGTDHRLVAELESLVQKENVALDLQAIDRIDAAGIAALISLYGVARETGHGFRLCNVRHRVAEILGLVGLEPILLPQEANCASLANPHGQRSAA